MKIAITSSPKMKNFFLFRRIKHSSLGLRKKIKYSVYEINLEFSEKTKIKKNVEFTLECFFL